MNKYQKSQLYNVPFTTGKTFFVASDTDINIQRIDELYQPDNDGVQRRHATFTSALAQCVENRGDIILTSPSFTTAITSAELASAEEKNVEIYPSNYTKGKPIPVFRDTSTLPQTGDLSLFTVTGAVELVLIKGEVTTVIQTQSNEALLKVNPAGTGADVDICAALDITGDIVGSTYHITGTLADALINSSQGGAIAKQASPIIITNAGVIELECSASNTGAIKWMLQYLPIDPGARIFAA